MGMQHSGTLAALRIRKAGITGKRQRKQSGRNKIAERKTRNEAQTYHTIPGDVSNDLNKAGSLVCTT